MRFWSFGKRRARRIEPAAGVRAMELGLEDAGAELDLPEHFEPPALVVVVEAGEDDPAGLVRTAGDSLLDEILPVPDLDDVAGFGPRAASRGSGGCRNRSAAARGFEEPG